LEEIDEAFNWLVLIIGTLTASLVQFPHLYPFSQPLEHPEIPILKVLLIPLVILIFSWLSSHIIQRQEARIILKCFSWEYALLILVIDLSFLLGVILGVHIFDSPLWLATAPPLGLAVTSIIYITSIRKQYRRYFPTSKFLASNKLQALFITIMAFILMIQSALLFGPLFGPP
jgi:hypothetical protein